MRDRGNFWGGSKVEERDWALKHLYELNPEEGRRLVLEQVGLFEPAIGLEALTLLPRTAVGMDHVLAQTCERDFSSKFTASSCHAYPSSILFRRLVPEAPQRLGLSMRWTILLIGTAGLLACLTDREGPERSVERLAYEDKVEDELVDYAAQIERMRALLGPERSQAPDFQELERRLRTARQRLQGLRQTEGATWESLREQLVFAVEGLRESYAEARGGVE